MLFIKYEKILWSQYRCPEIPYKAFEVFKKVATHCRHQKIAFVHAPHALEFGRRMLNHYHRGEPFKLWKKPLFDKKRCWHTSHNAGNLVRKKIHQLINTGIDKFWRTMQAFMDIRKFRGRKFRNVLFLASLSLDGNIETAFYLLLGGVCLSIGLEFTNVVTWT